MKAREGDIPLHIGRASDLSGRAYLLYRLLEILPAVLSWGTLIGVVLLSFYAPIWAAYLIIFFSLYWLLKTIYLSIHLRHNWRRILHNMKLDWTERLSHVKHEHVWHMVILPFSTEPLEVIERSVGALAKTEGNKKRMIVILAAEERCDESAQHIAHTVKERFKNTFGHILITTHPDGIEGEIIGKGSNTTYAIEEARKHVLDAHQIPYEDVLVSNFDSDTVAYPQYFQCLTWHFVTAEDPLHASYQPVPLYNNNIWHAPALARVVATSSSFWQMIQQERPEKLGTFSSHSAPFKALYDTGYWQTNMVSEDSRIFLNLFFANNGNYRVIPIAYPVSMDANFTPSFWRTMVNIYKQHRRWTWGVENVPYVIFQSLYRKAVPLKKRLRTIAFQVEGFWSLATHPLILLLLGWLPIVLGNRAFHVTVLSYNLPIAARTLLTIAMIGLIVSAAISLSLLPPRPEGYGRQRFIAQVLQWILIPVTMVIFSAIPGLEAQTRLAIGRRLGFWVTPKKAVEKADKSDKVVRLTSKQTI